MAKAEGKQVIDMGYHMAVTDLREGGSLEELATLPAQGVTSYKLFMAYKGALMVDDETLFRTMEVAAETGALVMVHAENGDAIDVLVKQALAAGQHGAALPRAYAPAGDGGRGDEPGDPARARRGRAALRRPRLLQGGGRPDRARARAGLGRLGRDVHAVLLHRLHVPRAARLRGREVRVHAAAARMENQEVLWHAVRTDMLSAISTDHCAFLWDGQKTLGRDDFSKIPNGGPGLENRLQMIHEFGVRAGRISLNRMVELLCTNPAKLFGLYPRKGTIAVGSDADIVVFDPEKRVTISAATHHSKARLQPLRGHGGDRVARARPAAWPRAGRRRRARRGAGRRRVRRARRFGEELLPAAAR